MATKAEKEAEDKAKAAEAEKIRQAEEDALKEKSDEELKAESDRVEAALKQKAEDLKKARAATQGTEEQDKMYSKAEVLSFIKQAVAEARKKEESGVESLDEEDPYAQKKVRLPRWRGKFVFGFDNTNTDEYFSDTVVQAFDQWNDLTKKNDPWVKAIFDDGTSLLMPLWPLIEKSQKVECDLVEVIATDKSYSSGKVERAEVKDYSRSGTGTYIQAKVTMADYKYKVRLPGTDKEVIVGKEVVNW